MPNNEEEIKKITIDGTSTEPFACPYCKKKLPLKILQIRDAIGKRFLFQIGERQTE